VGAGGWLFRFDGLERLAHVLGSAPISPDRTQERRRLLESRRARLAAAEIGYLAVTMPAKAAVYAEHLPPGIRFDFESRPAQELSAVLRGDPELELLDLLPVLRHARREGRVFLRQGRQLSWPGAFHAHRAVVKELAKRFGAVAAGSGPALELGELVEVSDPLQRRERIALVGEEVVPVLVGDEGPEQEPELVRAQLDAMYVSLPPDTAAELGPSAALLERGAGTDLPSAVVLHDGSGERLVPFLAEHFGRMLVEESAGLPMAAIQRERPLVVIQLLSEDRGFFS
jgi:hypothetical protein